MFILGRCKNSYSCFLVFGLKRVSCTFFLTVDRVTYTIWVLGYLSEVLHASWPTGFMSLCTVTYAFMTNKVGFLLCNSELQSACSCLLDNMSDDMSTAYVNGWIWLFLYWPSSLHLSSIQELKIKFWKVNVPCHLRDGAP